MRDPLRPSRLLRAEHDALLPILRGTPSSAFGLPTACPGWSVRDVLGHCSAALSRVITGDLHEFTPEQNEADVAERRPWPLPDLLAELGRGYQLAGGVIADAGGRLDAIALGEWIHGGDVRAALGEPLAYASAGFGDACALLEDWARVSSVPLTEVHLPGSILMLGVPRPDREPATLHTSPAGLMRIIAGRPVDPAGYQLTGATTAELTVF